VFVLLIAILAMCDTAADRWLGDSIWWRARLDPRTRILWDRIPTTAPIVVVGDSVFASFYVDAPEQRLSERLEARLGRPVFSASLNGARAEDMMSLARLGANTWPAGTVVYVGLHPARVFDPLVTTIDPTRAYERQFSVLVNQQMRGGSVADRIDSRAQFELARLSFLVRRQEWIDSCLAFASGRGPDWAGDLGAQPWQSRGDFAVRRLRELQASVARKDPQVFVPLAWVADIHRALALRGLRPIFVLTPLNRRLLQERSGDSGALEARLVASHELLSSRLRSWGYECIDLFDGPDDSAFADAIHTNAAGDDWMSARLASRLSRADNPR
jgi:hypothetical protein